MADAWADEPETTPAQRAAAIADKAVDEITNQGYHYWCATRVRIRVRLPPLARPTVPWPQRMRASTHASSLRTRSMRYQFSLRGKSCADTPAPLPISLPTHAPLSLSRAEQRGVCSGTTLTLTLTLTQARHGAQGRRRGAGAGADRAGVGRGRSDETDLRYLRLQARL